MVRGKKGCIASYYAWNQIPWIHIHVKSAAPLAIHHSQLAIKSQPLATQFHKTLNFPKIFVD